MIDVMSNGRLVAGMMRGTGNEYVTYNINPSESRERFAEAVAFDPTLLDGAGAVRLGREIFPVPDRFDLAQAGAESASADVHVDVEP